MRLIIIYQTLNINKNNKKKRDHNLPQNDTHKIKILKRSIICVVQYTSASSKHMLIVLNTPTAELCIIIWASSRENLSSGV